MIIKRILDILFSMVLFLMLLPVMLMIVLLIKLSSKGPVLYWSKRVGRKNHLFMMPKFRTMRVDTPQIATHLLSYPDKWLIPVGYFLRRYSLDEIPQLWNILKGDMSFSGPRPALFNQKDLISLRSEANVHEMIPGLTGWAQINGRDEISIEEKVNLDIYYKEHWSNWLDLKIIFLTFLKVLKKEGIKH